MFDGFAAPAGGLEEDLPRIAPSANSRQINPTLLCIALNRARREAADCLFAESGVGHSKVGAVGESSSGMRPGSFAIVGPRRAIASAGPFAFSLR
jgi:hypothetical protein